MSFECEAHEAPQCRLQVQKYTKNNFSSTSIDNRWEEKLTNTKTCVSSLILWHFAARFETMTTFSHHHHCSHCCSVNSLDVDEHYCNLSRLSLNCFSTSSDAHRRKCQLHHIDYCGKSMGKLIIIFTILEIIKSITSSASVDGSSHNTHCTLDRADPCSFSQVNPAYCN